MNPIKIVSSQVVVTALPDFNPLKNLPYLEGKLKSGQFIGVILFDLLYINGLSDNRFVEMSFDGTEFERKSFSIKHDIDEKLKFEQDQFFIKNPDYLLSSILSPLEMDEISASIAL